MTTANDWVEQVREMLGGGLVETVNQLAVDYIPGDLEVQFARDMTGIAPNVPICVGLNTFMVWSINTPVKTAEITSNWGSSPSVVAESGSLVRVKPAYFTHRIFNAINDTLTELSSPLNGIYGVDQVDIQYDQSIAMYDLTAAEDLARILRVQWGFTSDDLETWPTLYGRDWQLRHEGASAEFPSGKVLRINTDMIEAGAVLRVTYMRNLVQVSTLTDDVSMTYLPETAYDLPVLGAASRLSIPGEWRRNVPNPQGDSRRADEVPAGGVLGGARALRALYQERVEQEAARLVGLYPYRQN